MICLRCLRDRAGKVAKAPDGSGAWEVNYCAECGYSWRSSEGEEILNIEKRDKHFQLDDINLCDLVIYTPVPPLRDQR